MYTARLTTAFSQLALLIIAKCGFGFSFEWSAPPIGPDGTMSIQEALRILADSYIVGLLAPDWVRYLPGYVKCPSVYVMRMGTDGGLS